MNMSVTATGSSTLREYQKSAGVGAGTAFTEAAQQTLPAPTEGKHVKSPQGFHKLSAEELPSRLAMAKQMLEMQEYALFEMDQVKEKMHMQQEFFTKMRGELGGPETAMAIPNDPLGSEPVRTSSGGVHPQSERVKDYIRAHKDEWDSAHSVKVPTFEEWQKARG